MKKVVIYTGLRCAHCDWAKILLNKKNIDFVEYNISADPSKRDEMIKKSNGARTVPQIFINEKGIGGCDELYALEDTDELDSLLNQST